MTRGNYRAAAAGLAMVFATSALAGSVADKATEAESLVAAGDPKAAIAAFDTAGDLFWETLPLDFAAVAFADSIEGFGQYTARASSTFRSGEAVQIYLEPFGYGFSPTADGFTVAFKSGLEIRMADIVLGKTDDFGEIVWNGKTKSHAVHVALNVTLPELKPGAYQLLVTLNDEATTKSATATLPFTIAE